MPLTMLCIATYHKGGDFLDECHRQGCRVLLLTEEKLRDADWPRHAIDGFYYVRRDMPGRTSGRAPPISPAPSLSIASSPSTTSTSRPPPCCASTCTCPGHGRDDGAGVSRQARDALRARGAGIRCPEFVHAVNDDGPRPVDRADQSALGAEAAIAGRGHRHPHHQLRRRVVGDPPRAWRRAGGLPAGAVRRRRRLSRGLARLRWPRGLRHGEPLRHAADGGRPQRRDLRDAHAGTSEDAQGEAVEEENARVLAAFGLRRGVSHTEFIRGAGRRRSTFSRRPRASAARTSSTSSRPRRGSICGASGRRSRSRASTAATSRRRHAPVTRGSCSRSRGSRSRT